MFCALLLSLPYGGPVERLTHSCKNEHFDHVCLSEALVRDPLHAAQKTTLEAALCMVKGKRYTYFYLLSIKTMCVCVYHIQMYNSSSLFDNSILANLATHRNVFVTLKSAHVVLLQSFSDMGRGMKNLSHPSGGCISSWGQTR